jgi:Rrf2 family protein
MLTKTNEYALRVVTYLGENSAKTVTNADIAGATSIPAEYLYKIMRTLERSGLVRSQRGKHGGYSLSRSADEMTVLEVISVVDPLPRIMACPLGRKEHRKQLCPLHKRLDEVYAQIESAFRNSKISDLISTR